MTSILLKNATIYPITSEPILNSDLLIENGKISKIGKNLVIDSTVKIIDCNNKYLFPGFIDVHTHLGLYDEGTGWAGNDANETVEPLSPHIRAIDGVYPLDVAFSDAVKYGITTVHVMPGSANVIGGTTSVIKTAGKNIKKMIVKEIAGLKIALGENPKRIHSHGNNDSITRMGIMGMLREAFYNALHANNPDFLRNAPLVMALKKEIPVRVHAHRADDIITAIRLAEEFNLDLRIEHCTEGHLIAEELAGLDLKVSVGPTLTRRSKIELKNKTWKTYNELTRVGVEVSITTDHPYTPIQYLNLCAALAVREGLSEQKALEGITILPARNLRVDNQLGSIEEGKDADLVLWSHHPFHFLSKPKWTMIAGEFVYQEN
ncbi:MULTISPECIES: amidohydrolase [unclassified Bacillus (in: firmicutes)]|uniref:amidohydrolase n=1 Tax=unclassified Bacillus (in: firmicutes) TaxID=185979 RepID=UPI0008E4C107|nr:MULTISPECIES: amidohydrolase [unclassified Bacillus (in: firmicutes)]SFA91845.1 Imidazolonepropionase [Bacillus sp. UNCCL13]SFQ85690.1 Imidazolonepropionase [Bacillus sp. cl95]